jgi:hypothetical protein
MLAHLFNSFAFVIKIDDLNALENGGWSGIIARCHPFRVQPALFILRATINNPL